jgi:hypothetical protein
LVWASNDQRRRSFGHICGTAVGEDACVDINNCRPLFSASGHHWCINVVARNLLISNPVLAK